MVDQHHADIKQQIDPGLFPGNGVVAFQGRQVLFKALRQLYEPAGGRQRSAYQHQQGIEAQLQPFENQRPAAFGVGCRLAVGLVEQLPGFANKQVFHQLTAVQGLLDRVVVFILGIGQCRRFRDAGQGWEVRTQTTDAHVVRFVKTTVAVNHPGVIRQPRQYALLDRPRLGDGRQQAVAAGKFEHRISIGWTIKQVWPGLRVARFDNEHVLRHIGLGAGFALKGQRPHDDFIGVHPAICALGSDHGVDTANPPGCQPCFTSDFVLQGLGFQVDGALCAELTLALLRLGGVTEQRLLNINRVVQAHIDTLDQLEQVLRGQPRLNGLACGVAHGHAAGGPS